MARDRPQATRRRAGVRCCSDRALLRAGHGRATRVIPPRPPSVAARPGPRAGPALGARSDGRLDVRTATTSSTTSRPRPGCGSRPVRRRGRRNRYGRPMLFTRKAKELPTAETALPGRAEAMPVQERHLVLGTPLTPPFPDGIRARSVVGMGCFWGAERLFWQAPGVYTTAVGYAGGITPNPTYEEVCSGPHRSHRGRPRRLRPRSRRATRRCCALLGGARPDAGHAPGKRRRHAVPLGALLDDRRAASRGRGLTRELPAGADPRGLRADHHGDRAPQARSTTPSPTTSSTWRGTRTATAGSAARALLPGRHRRRNRASGLRPRLDRGRDRRRAPGGSVVTPSAPATARRDVHRNDRDDDHEQRDDVHDRLLDRPEEVREDPDRERLLGARREDRHHHLVPREREGEQRAGEQRRAQLGKRHVAERLPRVAAEVLRRFLEVAVQCAAGGPLRC